LLNESPLSVTSDVCLRAIDASALKYEPRFAHVLPRMPDQLFRKEVFSILQLYATSDDCLCKMLTVENFLTELSGILHLMYSMVLTSV